MDYKKLLIISDNVNIARLLNDFLIQSEYETVISDVPNALLAAALNPDLIIIQLERADELFDSLVTLGIPLFVLVSESSAVDRISLLERGADDIMTVPFDAREAVARIRALLRRTSAPKKQRTVCALDGLTVDLHTYTITCEGCRSIIPAKETELLFLLASNIGRVYRRREILLQIWHTVDMNERIVDMHISKLRSVIAQSRHWEIVGLRGVGYKLDRKNQSSSVS